MTYRALNIDNPAPGVTVISCTRGLRCKECGGRASIQCDYALAAKAARKCCDAWLCERCAHEIGQNHHYCGPHYRHTRRRL